MKYIDEFANCLIYKIKYLFIESRSDFTDLNEVIWSIVFSQLVSSSFDVFNNSE